MASYPQRKGWRRVTRSLPLWLVSLPALLFLALPLIAIVLRVPLDQLFASVVDRNVARAISLSLTTTLVTVVVSALVLSNVRITARLVIGVLMTVAGVVLILAG